MNMLGMIVFPFLMHPLLLRSGALPEAEFQMIVAERKKLIPDWLRQIMNV